MVIVGIDPGKKGGIAVLVDAVLVAIRVMPDTCEAFADMIEDLCGMHDVIDHVFLEKSQAMPKNGVCAMFNYGVHFGELRGVLVAKQLKHTLVPPNTWTREMHKGTPSTETAKRRSYLAVRRLFPLVDLLATERSKKPHDGIIDALLIAEYGRLHA